MAGQPLCGAHSRPGKARTEPRIELLANPRAAELRAQRLVEHTRSIEAAAAANRAAGRTGQVTARKMAMFGAPTLESGVLNVFPNFKHGGRADGRGMPRLSPKSLGPVDHGQPGLPAARTVENLHQGNKVFGAFYDAATGAVRDAFYRVQRAMYQDATPWRHQRDFLATHPEFAADAENKTAKGAGAAAAGKDKDSGHSDAGDAGDQDKKYGVTVKGSTEAAACAAAGRDTAAALVNANVPLFSVWRTPADKEIRLTYVESRQIYCAAYEALVLREPQFFELRRLLREGVNLCIIGYDAQDLSRPAHTRYHDPTRPFGHECVLSTMLTAPPTTWPWRCARTLDLKFALPLEEIEALLDQESPSSRTA